MEEEVQRNFSKSSDRNKFSDEVDLSNLFIRQIPLDVTKDAFISALNGNDRSVIRVMLNQKYAEGSKYTFGFARFATAEEAADALHALHGKPPLYLQVTYAKKRAENEDRGNSNGENLKFAGKGRGMRNSMDNSKPFVHSNMENQHLPSRGRGHRIDLEGSKAISKKIQVTTGNCGRIVSVTSPEKKHVPVMNGQFSDVRSPPSKPHQSISPQKYDTRKTDVSAALVPNPFYFCFLCNKEGRFSCRYCRKPYCSRNCQSADLQNHQLMCKRAKGVAETLLGFFKNSVAQSNDSSYMSENSNSDHEKSDLPPAISNKNNLHNVSKSFEEECKPVEKLARSPGQVEVECKPVEKLAISPGQVEVVSVINIHTPSKFWIRLKKFSEDFLKMERELTSHEKDLTSFHSTSSIIPHLNCCTLYNSKICRAEVLKVKSPNEILVNMFDYGKTVTVQKNALYNLPKQFRKLPMQAVSCKLVSDAMKGDIQWNDEDIHSFQLHTCKKNYKARVVRCCNDVYDVSLINEDGINLYSILTAEKEAFSPSKSDTPQMDGSPPSIWPKLKPGNKMMLISAGVSDENSIWCYLSDTTRSDLNVLKEIDELLKNYSGEDITLTAEEGEFAAGFSDEFKQYFRCMLIKRKQRSFIVRYIDYGNEEEITRLCSLSQELSQKCCCVVKCEKPSSLTFNDFVKFLGDKGAEVTVVKVKKNEAELSFNFGKKYSMFCYPCYSNLESEHVAIETHATCATAQIIASVPDSKITTKPTISYKEVTSKIIIPKVLSLTKKYAVNVSVFKTVSELYVQLREEETAVTRMHEDLNSFCNSKKGSHVPSIREIVACKFSADGAWYRGQVLEKMNNKYRVFFVDYGNEDIVLQNDIQLLPDKFVLPQFSICVSLSGIKNEDLSCLLNRLIKEVWEMKVIDDKKTPVEVMLFQKDIPLSKMIENKINKRSKSSLKFQKLPSEAVIKICFEDEKYVYVNQVKDLKPLEELGLRLKSLGELPVPKKPLINNVYCGLFVDDGLWYRVSIEEEVSPCKYKVFFLDFGNYGNVSVSDLRELPDDLFALPVYCTPVLVQDGKELSLSIEKEYTVEVIGMLKDVQKVKFPKEPEVTIFDENQNMKSESCLMFKKLPNEETINIKLCHEDEKYIYLHQACDLETVSDLFNKLNNLSELDIAVKPLINNVYCGLFTDGFWYRVSIKEVASSNTFKVFFLDYGNYEILSIDNLRELPSEFFSIPVCCIPVVVEKREELALNLEEVYKVKVTGIQGDVQKIKFMIQQKDDSCSFQNKAVVVRSEHDLKFQQLSSETTAHVKVCYKGENCYYLHQVKDLDSLTELFVKLLPLADLPHVEKPVINGIYCGKFSDDGLWYRVCVKEELSSNTYKVLFLDYGNYENVCRNDLRDLPNDLFKIPIISIPVVAENKEKLDLNIEEQYTVQVTGKQGEYQKVKFLLPQKEETIKLPHISALKKRSLGDTVTEVLFCHKEKDTIYCQLSSDSATVLDMYKALQRCGREGKSLESASTGDVICAKCSDNQWYRACVICDKMAPSYKVSFFDYGNTENVTGDCVKILPSELLELPIFAIPMKFKNIDEITDASIFTKPMLVKKISILGDVYVVELQVEEETSSLLKISDLKRITLPNNCVSNVSVSHIEGSIYYVQPASNMGNLNKLKNELSKAETFSNLPHSLEVGDVICGKFVDGDWYRCTVEEIHLEKLKVCFIDYGNTDLLDNDNLKALPLNLGSYPVSSVPVKFSDGDDLIVQDKIIEGILTFDIKVCKLEDNIQVVNLVSEASVNNMLETDVSHSPTFLSTFEKPCLPLKLPCKVIFKKHVDNSYMAIKCEDELKISKLSSLLQESQTGAISHVPSVNEMLLAKRVDNLWHRCCVVEVDSGKDTYKVYFVDLSEIENVHKNLIGYLPENCKCYPLFAIKVLVESEASLTLDKPYFVQALKQNPDNTYCVRVYHQHMLSSIGRKELPVNEECTVIFYHKEGGILFLQNLADAKIIQIISSECSSGATIPYDPVVGELVCAMSQLDNSWYRGCIEEIVSADKYKVLFIDYGNSEIVQKEHLQSIPFSLAKFPSLCIPVKFANEQMGKNITLNSICKVLAQCEAHNNIQIIRLVEAEEEERKQIVNVEPVCDNDAKKFTYTSYKSVPFSAGEQDIFIYNAEELNLFWAPYNLENIEANLSLPAVLSKHCKSKGIPFDDCEPEFGEMVLAYCPAYDEWYRAAVIDKSHPIYIVNLVDFGNTERLDVSCLRKMEEQFMELDIQAHMCSLTGFTVPEENLETVNAELKKFTSRKEPLRAHIEVVEGEITAEIPEITASLIKKNLVTAVNHN